ncbi:MAG TPA: hypothetical protein DEG17_25290 [Cyanobacteria bacterium UBA11149]|nr:hypothetical protein [Cyanobacteria bacterium UBA11367]HBE60880.1 hypothetical protein [Cyanobacteria bacterium UBA11366]HBK66345.1 hypothetical protein [Cyanobacteria bacterium UBA11166]HBR74892.1 hypothetical protein [Cyanobacteria bacterium UBA11159]HBS67979.1 hypothetical protein [Cyanobacteria bacterium UBA11153]HBW92092.1 hypothetical protein [Cyanobacteria bacterium UBA11149]HCA96472.1 hypothetical protein [Cyanobacteria bacterium UBA9226]
MFPVKYPVPQTEPPPPPREALPTMYDLPSENSEEPGLPDEFHGLQAQFLSSVFRPPNYPLSQVFSTGYMNLYYDVRHPQWYKRPDWFGVVGVSRLYDEVDMRLSYVVWQEGVNPFVIVEFLSPGTEKEDLGKNQDKSESDASENLTDNGQVIEAKSDVNPPRKWEVYEKILRIPYYVVFSRYTNQLRVFKLTGGRYQEITLQESRLWIPELALGLGLWQGEYQGVERLWLRWYDFQGNWIPTEAEEALQLVSLERQRADDERQRADDAESRLESLMQRLRESGINPHDFFNNQS